MNCKPGDLAIRVKALEDSFIPCGAIVRCIKRIGGLSLVVELNGRELFPRIPIQQPHWEVEWNGQTGLAIPENHLRPIRDPGEDAQDETLNWLPVPSRDEVTA